MKSSLNVLISLKVLSAGLVFAAGLLFLVGDDVSAGEIEPNFADYLNTLSPDEFVSAIVIMADQADVKSLDASLKAERATRRERHTRVVSALKSAASRSQGNILDYLQASTDQGSIKGYTPYWIMNLVVIQVTVSELAAIAARPDVEMIESNFRAGLIEPVGDESGPVVIPDKGIGVTPGLRAVKADSVWYQLGITGLGRLVANLDTGVDGAHPALTGRWRGNHAPWQECWKDALGYGTTYPVDYHSHGTHVMGTLCGLGAATNDTIGIAWDAEWIADNAINQAVTSEFDNDVLQAFQWFADPDGNPGTIEDVPDVVQNSWGIDSRFGYDYQDCDYRWQEAIENCEAAGVVVTFSAGNEGPNAQSHRSPANICNTPTVNFSVGAVDAEAYDFPFPIAYFSSRGPSDCDGTTIKPEVSAPGVSVYSSYPGGGYTRMSGTSMAGPHVAGVVALMRQANPNADVQTIKNVLMQTARDLGPAGEDNDFGWGVIDAYEAVLAVMQPDTEPPVVAVTAPNGGEVMTVGSSYTIAWTATDNVGVTSSSLYYSFDGGANYSLIANLPGNPESYAWTVPDTPSTQCLVQVYAYDAAANEGSDVSDAYFTIEESHAPYVWVPSLDLSISQKGANVEVVAQVLVWDENNQPVKGAQVSSHWDGLSTDTDIFFTKKNGAGSCTSDKLKNPMGWWYYYIDDVAVSGYVFRNDIGEVSDAIYAGGIPLAAAATDRMSVAHSSTEDGMVEFSVGTPRDAHVSFALYNVAGRRVRTLLDETVSAGYRTLVWDGTDDSGRTSAPGIYFYRLVSDDTVLTDRLMLVR